MNQLTLGVCVFFLICNVCKKKKKKNPSHPSEQNQCLNMEVNAGPIPLTKWEFVCG